MPDHGDILGFQSNHLLMREEFLARFALRVAEFRRVGLAIAVCHMVTGSELPSSVGITTRCRPTVSPISFVPPGQGEVIRSMPTDPDLNMATRTLPSSTKPARSIVCFAKTGITDTDPSARGLSRRNDWLKPLTNGHLAFATLAATRHRNCRIQLKRPASLWSGTAAGFCEYAGRPTGTCIPSCLTGLWRLLWSQAAA